MNGHGEVLRLLVEAGADMEERNSQGRTALMVASLEGHQGVVEALLRAGAQVEAADEDGGTALMVASLNGHQGVVEQLLRAERAAAGGEEAAGVEEAGPSNPRQCAACGVAGSRRVKAGSTQLKLRTCSACHGIWYCGRKCQLEDWEHHKLDCPGRG